MEFWTDIAFAVLLRLLKERRGLDKFKPAFIKLAQAILDAFPPDENFKTALGVYLNRK